MWWALELVVVWYMHFRIYLLIACASIHLIGIFGFTDSMEQGKVKKLPWKGEFNLICFRFYSLLLGSILHLKLHWIFSRKSDISANPFCTQAMQREHKLSSYSLNSVSAHFLNEQARFYAFLLYVYGGT